MILFWPAPCEREACNAPYNLGCRNEDDEAVCICPECEGETSSPVCSKDGVEDVHRCEVRRQSCLVGQQIEIAKEAPCGKHTRLQ